MNKISTRQLLFFLSCIAPVGKIVLLPTRLAYYTENDLWLPMLFQYLLQTAIVFCVLLLAKRKMSFGELLENTFGKIVARIILVLFSLFLLYATLVPLLEQKLFVQSTFYDTLPSLIAFIPYFLFAAYLLSKPLACCGRMWDILAPVTIAGFFGILILSISAADYGALLPVGASGGSMILSSTMSASVWFYDAAILLFLLGKFDYQKGLAFKGAIFYFLGGAAVLFFCATFYGVFESTALNQLFAFAKTSKYFSGITQLGRVDYIFIFALAMTMAFYCILPAQAAIDNIRTSFHAPDWAGSVMGAGVSLILFITVALTTFQYNSVLQFISEKFAWIFPVFTVAIPVLSLLLRRDKKDA